MKKSELKVLVKEAKKAVKADIEKTVVAALTESITKLGHDSKKLTKEIVKGSKKLAKKISERH